MRELILALLLISCLSVTAQSINENRAEFIELVPNFYFKGDTLVQTITLGDNGPEFIKELEITIDEIASTTLNMWKNDSERLIVLKQIAPTNYRVEYIIGSKRIISKTLKTNI